MIRRLDVSVTTDSAGAGTVQTPVIAGLIREIRYNGTTLNNSGSADYTLTRKEAGGTILALSNTDGPWQRAPYQDAHTTAGAGGTVIAPIPVAEQLQVVVAAAAASATDTIRIYYEV